MIEILFPPGCYGSYLSRCIYNYTNLRVGDYSKFTFDKHGSSHSHRHSKIAKSIISQGHLSNDSKSSLSLLDFEKIVTILPVPDHNLDYYTNQYFKEDNKNFIKYMQGQLNIEDINNKLTAWGYDSLTNAPQWAVREFLSYYIMDCFTAGYSVKAYAAVPNKLSVTTQDIILNIEHTLDKIFKALKLTLTVNKDDIQINHDNFIKNQIYHNLQLKCNEWVTSTIESDIPVLLSSYSIFDEAYIQQNFRSRGYEIKCDGLDILPQSSVEMKHYIYKI